METTFQLLENNRRVYSEFLQKFSLEQLNKIPDGFSNNIIWNIGHVIVVQQLLVYKLSGLPMLVTNEMVELYKNGSKPTMQTSAKEVEEIKRLLSETVHQTKADFTNIEKFKSYTSFTTKSTGFTMNSVQEALEFNNFHEGVHLGVLLQIKKFL